MTIKDYERDALKYANGFTLTEAVLGLCGEAGECAEMLKKHKYQGHKFDSTAFAKELGDVAWYLNLAAFVSGYTLEEILNINIQKLKKRYPEGFDRERSIHREEE